MPGISTSDLISTAIVLLFILVMLFVWLTGKGKKTQPYINPAGYESIDVLMNRSSEEGKGLLVGLGEGFSGLNGSLGDQTGISVQRMLMSRSVFNDLPAQSYSGDGALACISQMVVYNAYENAMAIELFRPEHNQLTGIGGYSWMAGLLPELSRSNNLGLVLAGSLRPESLLIADLAERKDTPILAATGDITGQAALFASGASTLLGEDFYLPAIGEINRSSYQYSARVLNSIRILLATSLLLAAILKLSGVLP